MEISHGAPAWPFFGTITGSRDTVNYLLFKPPHTHTPGQSCLRVWFSWKSHDMMVSRGWKWGVSQAFEACVCSACVIWAIISWLEIPNIPVSYWIWQPLVDWCTGCDLSWVCGYSRHWHLLLLCLIMHINKNWLVTTCPQRSLKYFLIGFIEKQIRVNIVSLLTTLLTLFKQ